MRQFNHLPILLCTLLTVTLAEAQTAAPSIFQSARSAQAQPDRGGKRQRSAAIDMSLFDRAAARRLAAGKKKSADHKARMRMNLFDNLPLTVAWESAQRDKESGNIIWSGKLEDQPLSHAVFVAGEDGVTGNVSRGDGIVYQVRPAGNGEHTITEIDQKSFPNEAAPKYPPAAERSASDSAALDDDGTTIDVLVAYTAAARQAAGGEAQMLKLIQLGIAETNQGYANSGVVQRVRLVGTGEVNYTESGSLDTDLDRLSENGDKVLDEVHPVRDRAGADIVSLWVEKGDACGIGWQLQDPTRVRAELGFHVVRRDCATGYFSFGHEMGHNMGASHAREDGAGGAFPYSFGYKQVAVAPFFRTVMAYDCKGGCPRVNYWSSAETSYNGKPTGTRAGENNALTLNNTAKIVANFRKSTQGGGQTPPPVSSGNFPESDHPYANDVDRTWTYTAPGNPASINVTFDSKTYVEEDYDYIGIYDASGKMVPGGPFTGDELAGKTVTVSGAAVRIRLVTDESETFYGFKVANITAKGGSGNGGGKPDLAAISLKVETSAKIGGKVAGVDAKIQNKGTGAAGEFRIGFYWLSAAKEVVFSGWSCAVKGLDPGATYTCGGEIGVPASLAPGTYQLAVIADDQKQTGDSDWENNARLAEAPVKLQ